MFCFIFILQAVHCGSGLEWRCEGLECEILLGAGPCAVRAYFFVEKHFLFANKEFYENPSYFSSSLPWLKEQNILGRQQG